MKHTACLLLLFLVAACSQPGKQTASTEAVPDTVRYATGFRVSRTDAFTVVEVVNPWDTAKLLQRYVLIDRTRPVPGNLPQGTLVRIPLRNVAVYTSVHASMIDRLSEVGNITGVCEPEYMTAPGIREGLRSGRIANLGMTTAPNVEKMIDTGVECIIASPFKNSDYGQAGKLGIPIVEGADYMESHPLGRAEWIRFFGLLFRKEEVADSIFRETGERYLALRALASGAAVRPTVFSEKRYGSSWDVAGRDSYVAHLFRDAGAGYIFEDIPGGGSVPLSFETVLDRAINADVWLIKYNLAEEMTYRSLRAEYTPYEHFDAWKKRTIYTCNTGKVPYYEESPSHPDRLLKDFIHIFHPGLLPDYTPSYYAKME
jgi:iron complex transport system substrate-binding protein